MRKLLVVDSEPNVLSSMKKKFQSETLEVVVVATGQQALEQVEKLRPEAVVLDVRLPDLSGLEVFDKLRRIDPHLPVIVTTAVGTTETAIEAMKRGAFEYFVKPIDFHYLREVIDKALELSCFRHAPAVFDEKVNSSGEVERMVGRSPIWQEVYKAIGRVAGGNVTVLITGESGTGKELVARALFQHSGRADKPFLSINCAAIPEALLESELFGHERGAFTGADSRRIGKFEQAHQGTLFLDEIGDMTPATQAKVLRVLQEQRFERVGGNTSIQTDVRLVAATNKDLEKEMAANRFRADLFYRLNVFAIPLPPLRQRRDDILLLTEHFLRVFSRTLGKPIPTFLPEVNDFLLAHPWPGNVRQLQSVILYALLRCVGDRLTLDCLPEDFRSGSAAFQTQAAVAGLVSLTENLLHLAKPQIYRLVVMEVDRAVLTTVLRHVQGNQVQASELLGISRTTLRAKLRSLEKSPQ